ncbi:predicted protein [Scheffersomyces stipitis CBS 6054]|uniref:Uncharacterized protein n=1 Tax=Scheffersomyces stipitis (strain ATCC 58785 / CBS 6054 / NBRC 10063 / NRRL Y-11545) TaxID=322104 RepID=A3LWX9_PICST|nr:predicted protein [Scheffersomyces stipitis CBS 6054]ABN67712.2 predicted protein [Scheffersomyces stipitis CBS 6054]
MTFFSELIPKKELRDLIVVFTSDLQSKIQYSESDTKAIYTISNITAFSVYLEKLLVQEFNQIHVIIQFRSYQRTLEIINFLYRLECNRDAIKQTYQNEFNANLNSLSKANETGSLLVGLGPGQCDLPVQFRFSIVLDSSVLLGDPLSKRSIALQQHLRYIALKHGGSIYVVSNFKQVLSAPADLVLTKREPQPIYEQEVSDCDSSDQIVINQHIPRAWDSWNKILLVSKSANAVSEFLFSNEEDIEQFDKDYTSSFSANSVDATSKLFRSQDSVKTDTEISKPETKSYSLSELLSV